MVRSVWKGPFFQPFNLPKLAQNTSTVPGAGSLSTQEVQLRTTARKCVILPSFIGHTFHVHNGKKFIPVRVTEEMIGHRLGEFAFTKKPAIYRIDNANNNNNKSKR